MRFLPAFTVLVALGAPSVARAGNPTARECIDANESAIKFRSAHKLVAARDQFAACAKDACPSEIRSECATRLEDVNGAIPTVIFEAVDAKGNDLVDVEIHVDGKLLVQRLDGMALPLDPGPHTFTFEAVNKPFVSKTIVLHEAEKERHERVVFPVTPETAPPAPKPPPPESHSSQRTIGLVTAGAGVVGLALGGYFGLRAKSAWNDSQAECVSPTNCANHAQALSDHDKASSAATLSTVFFALGGAAFTLGGVLFFTAPELEPGRTPSAALHVGGVF